MTNDGTCTFIIDDIRDMTRVGAVTTSLYLPPGYIYADGTTKNRNDFPRLVALIEKYNLWTDDFSNNLGRYGRGNGDTTFVVPNMLNRWLFLGGTDAIGQTMPEGLPDIGGTFDTITTPGTVPTGVYQATPGDNTASAGNINNNIYVKYTFKASFNNTIYGKSNRVQPMSIQLLPIIRY